MKKLILAVLLAGCTGKYVRDVDTSMKIDATPERIARGSYLVNQIGACGACHTPRDQDGLEGFIKGGERSDKFLGGGMFAKLEGMGQIWIPNITPDVETGIGGWTDDEIMRGIRDGVHKDGTLMFPMMPFSSYKSMSDDDVRAVVAYLRTVPPVKLDKPRQEVDLGFMGNLMLFTFGVAAHEPAKDVKMPDRNDKLVWGEYVMRLGHCWECHSSTSKAPNDKGHPEFMSGNIEADPIIEKVVGKVYMRNLTPDEATGLGKYSADQIKQAIRTGKRLDGKPMAPPMSIMIPHYSGMSDEDLDALVAFLKSIPPVNKQIPERQLLPDYEKQLMAGQ